MTDTLVADHDDPGPQTDRRPGRPKRLPSIRNKLMATVLVVSVAAVGVGLTSLYETNDVATQGRLIYTNALVPNQVLSDLYINVVQARFDVLSRSTAANHAAFVAANAALNTDERNVAQLTAKYASENSLSAEQQGLLSTFNQTWVQYKLVRDTEVTPALLSGNLALYEKLRTTKLVPLVNKALGVLNSLTTQAESTAKARLAQATAAETTARTSILAELIGMILVSLALSWAIATVIMRPVIEVRDILDAVAQNDLTRTADVRTADELGQMATSLNTSISHLRSLHEELSDQALHDALTGLPNRAAFLDYLGHELSVRPTATGVLFIDLDGFKAVNDTEGHAAGDALLVEVAARIREAVRGTDVVARLGGDEFVVICTGLSSPEIAEMVCTRIINKVTAPFLIGGQEIVIGASIGVSIAQPESSPAQMLEHADLAMYRSKTNGKGRQTFFDISMLADR